MIPNPNVMVVTYRSVHSATLGKGKSDDTLVKIRRGDLKGKGEVALVFGKQVLSVYVSSTCY